MNIKEIEVKNFKSFKHLNIDLQKLNVLVGPNAAGKSNFIRIFKFLRNVVQYNLNDAISIEGGVEYFRNIGVNKGQNLSFRIRYNPETRGIPSNDNEFIGVELYDAVYEFEIRFHKKGKGYNIMRDKLQIFYRFVELEEVSANNFEEKEILGEGHSSLSMSKGKVSFDLQIPEIIKIEKDRISPLASFSFQKLPEKSVLLETPLFELAHGWFVSNDFRDITIYDFDPKLSQKSVSVTGKAELEENGANLSLVLNNIWGDKEKRRRFLNLTTDVLDYVDSFRVQKQTDKSLIFGLQEKYAPNAFLPAFLLSDGTISIIALIIALFFEDRSLIILEEPERNIHPSLIRRVVEMLNAVSEEKQIFVTTHNPEFVKHVSLEDLIFISRDKEGFSTVKKVAEQENVRIFLENEIGIADLHIDNLLGV